MSRYSYMQGNSGSLFAQYSTQDNTQPQTNNLQSQPRTPSTHQSSQSNTTQIVDSFLSDVPQGIYSENSSLDNSSAIPTIPLQDSSDLTPHTPESLLYSPALDSSSLGTDLNSRKQQLRRSPRILNNRTPQTSEQQSDSTSLRSQESLNNRELVNKNPAALALEVLNESTDLNLIQQILSEHINREVSPSNIEEKNTLVSRNLDNHRMEIDSENRDINELRDLITTSNMILDTVHHNSASHMNHGYPYERHKETTRSDKSFTPPHEVSQSELEREHEHENEYPESVDLIISNETSDTLLRQSEHYNNMASKISNLKFIKVEPESEEEVEQFTTPSPGLRRSTRKRTTANYSYPRYSYGGGSSKRSKTRKRSRSFRKRSLPAPKNETDVYSGVANVGSEGNEEIDEPVHELSPIQSDEEQGANEDANEINDSENIDKNIPDNKLQGNLYLKHDLRSRKIMLESPETAECEESEEEEPIVAVAVPSKKPASSKRPAKKSTLKEKSARTTIKRNPSRISRKKIKDPEWYPNEEADSESGNDSEAVASPVTPTPRGRRAISKTRSASKASTTPEKATAKNVKSSDTTPEVNVTKKSLSIKATPKTPKTPKITRMVRKSTRGRGRGRGRGGSRLKDRDTEYKYSGGEESESEIEATKSNSDDMDNSENQIVRELSDVEMNFIQEEIEPIVAVVEKPVTTPTRPKRTRKSTKSPINESVINAPKSTRSTRSRDGSKGIDKKSVNALFDDDIIRDKSPDKEEIINVPEVQQAGLMPKKTARGTRGGTRGGKGRGGGNGRRLGGRVCGNTDTDQPSVPTSDPDIVEISAGNPMVLANAVRALAGQNYDIVHSPEDIVDIASIEEVHPPVFVKPTCSTSLSNTPPEWTIGHWQSLKVLYEETKNEYISSGKDVSKKEDLYGEITKKFFEVDINNRIFGEENLHMRILALETADDEKSDEHSGNIQRRSSIESNGSRYNKAYSNLRDNVAGTKRKRSESNATNTPENKKEHKNEEDDETEDKVPKRPRVDENIPSGSVTTPAAPTPHDGMWSKLFGSLFRGGRSQSNPELLSEEIPGESANDAGENGNIMEDDEASNFTRSRSWLW